MAWPPVTPDPDSNYFQNFTGLPSKHWNKEQWTLNKGAVSGAGTKTATVTNAAIQITEVSRAGEVSGTPKYELIFRFENGLKAVPASFVGSFNAKTKNLKGISFELQWNNPRPNEYIVITVTPPLEAFNPQKQQIAIVLDASAFKRTGNSNSVWHPMSFNTAPFTRETTEFAIHYFPGKTWKGQYGSVNIRNFGCVKEVIS